MNKTYEAIIDLPHHQSALRPHMSMHDRAAQFAPFAALTGHDEAIDETARLTSKKMVLDDDEKSRLDDTIRLISERLHALQNEKMAVAVKMTYFMPDLFKAGGQYVTVETRIKKIDGCRRSMTLDDGKTVPFDDIYSISARDEKSGI